MDQTQLQWLINEGDKLFEKVGNESFFNSEKSTYEFWLNSAIDFVGRYKIGSTNPLKIYNSNLWPRWSSDRVVHYGGDGVVLYRREASKPKPAYSLMDFSNLFEKQINFLHSLEEKVKSITIEKNGLITNLLTEKSYQYSPNLNLFKMIIFLVRKGDFVNGTTLKNEIGYYDLSTLKDGIKRVNKTLQQELGFREFIIHPNHKSGYKIDPQYKVELK